MSPALLAAGLCLFGLNAPGEEPSRNEGAKVLSTRPVGVRVLKRGQVPAEPQEEKREAKRNPPFAVSEEAVPKAVKGKRRAPVVQEQEQPSGADVEAKPKAARPKPVVKRPAAARPSAGEGRRLADAEARASKLAADNARLQQELAKGQGLASPEIKTPEEALAELKAGNGRFVQGKRVRTLLSMQDPELRGTLAKGQAPFAVVLTCSDSRLADNLIFDQELGRLFTIREAGNCADLQGLASVEYAVEHLGSKLVVVLGHGECGAVKAVSEACGKVLPGNLWSLQAAMAGLLETTPRDPNETPAEHLGALVEHNARRQAQALLDRSELVRRQVGAGKLRVLPAVYDLASGQVKFLEPAAPGAEPAGHAGH